MSLNGAVQLEMTFDPTCTMNGPQTATSYDRPCDDENTQDNDMNDNFVIPEDDDEESTREVFVVLEMTDSDDRFGFSVMGGIDEGFLPKVDEILPGSPADRSDLDVGDEILEVNGKSLHNASHAEVINHIHQCVRSRTISLRVRRNMGLFGGEPQQEEQKVQDAYVVAVEKQAKNKIAQLKVHNNVKASSNVINGYTEPDYTTLDGFSSGPTNEDTPHLTDASLVNGGYIKEPEIHDVELHGDKLEENIGTVNVNGIQNDAYSSSTDSLPDIGLQNRGANTVTTNADVEPLANIQDTDSVRSYEYPDYNGQGAVVDEVALTSATVSRTELPPLTLDRVDSQNHSQSGENKNKMVVQAELQSAKPERRAPREVAVDCPPSFVAASGMKNPPPQYNHTTLSGTPHQNGGSSIHHNGTDHLTNSLTAEKSGQHNRGSEKRKLEENRGVEQQNASQNNSQGAALTFQPVSTNALFDEQPKATVNSTPADNRKALELPKLLASLDHLQSKLGDGRNARTLQALESLLQNTQFQQVLRVHNHITEVHQQSQVPLPITGSVEEIAAEVKSNTKSIQSDEAEELRRILDRLEIKSLLSAHDRIASRDPTVMLGSEEDEELENSGITEDDSVKIVRIDKTNEPLGATILNDGETVVIGRIIKGGMAERSGLLHEGDEILEINGTDVQGKSVNEICDYMSTLTGTLTFLMVPTKQQLHSKNQLNSSALVNMRAHFDYDPEDDMYIPCRELGLSFHKGDILHIIAQDDSNWWQAYREGEEDQTLAGLIPSRTFQQQREAMKQTLPEDEEPKKKFFCGGKSKKKKKKKKLYNANANDQSSEEILTYEEVGLYTPDPDMKRPIVLIGPPKVGRHELRQRLLESDERFAAAVPHTSRSKKDHEVNGVDYFFTTRQQFEQDILAEKFVEHGEYEKNIYGTSLEAIRSVVNDTKICVLNLHPQPAEFKHGMRKARTFLRSLKVLKNSDLKPYFIFICPPSLDRLRQQRTEAGELLKEEELREIIETGRAMEDAYGHYFDYVIIHYDHDRAFLELTQEIERIEQEPQWAPVSWLSS